MADAHQSDDPAENLYASPMAASVPLRDPPVELHGRMPTSVRVAIGSLWTLSAALMVIGVGVFLSDSLAAASTPFGLAVGGFAFSIGLAKRNRTARRVTLICSTILGVIVGLAFAAILFVLMVDLVNTGSVPGVDLEFFAGIAAAYLFPLSLIAAIELSLTRESAREYFGLTNDG